MRAGRRYHFDIDAARDMAIAGRLAPQHDIASLRLGYYCHATHAPPTGMSSLSPTPMRAALSPLVTVIYFHNIAFRIYRRY